jgi:hypothetical protein
MAGRDSLRSTIEELKDYTERINSRVTDDILLEAEDGRQAIGFTFQHGGEGGDTLTVLGVENEERIQVNYPFDLADALASDRLSEDEVTQDVFDREAQIARRDLATAFESKSERKFKSTTRNSSVLCHSRRYRMNSQTSARCKRLGSK